MKATIISILITAILIGGAVFVVKSGNGTPETQANNVSVVDGKQIIEITAKGGYSPRLSAAKADIPTVIRVSTTGTFDCSAAISIPSIGYRKNLPASGITEIEVPAQKAGTKLQGLCAMGMYNFVVRFN